MHGPNRNHLVQAAVVVSLALFVPTGCAIGTPGSAQEPETAASQAQHATLPVPTSTPPPLSVNGRNLVMAIEHRGGDERLILREVVGSNPGSVLAVIPLTASDTPALPGVYFALLPDGAHRVDPIVLTLPGARAITSTMPVLDSGKGRRYLGVAVAVDPQRFPIAKDVIVGLNWIDSAGQQQHAP